MAQTELDEHSEPRYRDEEWLRQKYIDEGLTSEEVGELCGVSGRCILNWMERFGISRREAKHRMDGKKYTDGEWLRERYVDEELTQEEISALCDCDRQTIGNWLEEFGIDTRPRGSRGRRSHFWEEYTSHWVNVNGYAVWRDNYEGERETVRTHRLAAVAWFGWDAVVDREVHHRIPVKWLNVESNLLPLPEGEHRVISNVQMGAGVSHKVVEDVVGGIG